MSIEALAMAGADYRECGIDFEEWEACRRSSQPPPHLLVEDKQGIEGSSNIEGSTDKLKEKKDQRAKAEIREWAKAVAAMSRALMKMGM